MKYLIAGLILVVLLSIFALQNSGPVNIQFFFWKIPSVPLVLVIAISILSGALLTYLLGVWEKMRKHRKQERTEEPLSASETNKEYVKKIQKMPPES